MNARRGFTLVELMIVIVILGILAAIAVPKYNVTTHKSKEKEADMLLAQLYRLQQVYWNEHGEFAPTEADLLSVGFKNPGTLRYYTWSGNVAIPQCIASTGPWKSRQVLADGDIVNCP
jgi:prepilin-type N-terminal cleavage/methylation domain-containing protein